MQTHKGAKRKFFFQKSISLAYIIWKEKKLYTMVINMLHQEFPLKVHISIKFSFIAN